MSENLPEKKEKSKLQVFGELLTQKRDYFAQVLPSHMRPDRLIKVALMAINRQPLLLQCTQASLFQSLLAAASLGLEPDGVLGSAYLVPFKRNKQNKTTGEWSSHYEAQLIPGYRGLIDLARRSGQIKSIEAHVIREGDRFECSFGLAPSLSHAPQFPGTSDSLKDDKILGAYAVAKLKDGGSQFEVMSKAEIDAIRARSQAKDKGPWVTDYPEMARKTVVRRLVKYLPISVELATAVELDNRAEDGSGIADLVDVDYEMVPEALPEPEPETTRTNQIKEAVRRGKQTKPPDSPATAPEPEGSGSIGKGADSVTTPPVGPQEGDSVEKVIALCKEDTDLIKREVAEAMYYRLKPYVAPEELAVMDKAFME